MTQQIGEFIRQRRDAAGLTQKELAGVGTRFISELERGKSTVRMAEVDAVLAAAFKESVVDDWR